MTGSEVATKDEVEAGALAPISAEEQQLADQIKGRIDKTKITLPALKVGNGTSSDLGEDVSVGDLYNSVTQENFGKEVELVVCGLFEGYFLSVNDGEEAFSAPASAVTVPSNWPEEYAGKRFDELPDTEENYKARLNDESDDSLTEWGEGPPISTSHNFVVINAREPGIPMRLSLMRSNTKTASKLYTLIAGGRVPWDKTVVIEAEERQRGNSKTKYYGFAVRMGSQVDGELRQEAVRTAQAFQAAEAAGKVELAGDEGDQSAPPPSKPAAREGGLGVDG